MYRTLAMVSLLASVAAAQGQAGNSQAGDAQAAPAQAAPIVRAYQQDGGGRYRGGRPQERVVESQPVAGVWLRSDSSSTVKTVSATAGRTEVSLEHGKLNVSVHHPAEHSEILIDLPGGQTSLLKDGLYTFNAETNTVRVLRGEAAYVGAASVGTAGVSTAGVSTAGVSTAGVSTEIKPVKIKEDHQISLVGTKAKAVEAYPYELNADLLPRGERGEGYAGDGEYIYPYYAGGWGYPYGYGFYPGYYPGYYAYPFAYGIGFGYYGGFGGYRGGFRR